MQHPLAESVSSTPHITAASPQARDERDGAPSGVGLAVDALDYHLPAECIATHPAQPRDSARMLVLRRSDPAFIEHRHVRDLAEYLHAGDALVFNNTAVAPARLDMRRASGGRVEGLFLEEKRRELETSKRRNEETSIRSESSAGIEWLVMLRSGGRVAVGDVLTLIDREGVASDLSLRVIEHQAEQWLVALESNGAATHDVSTQEALDRVGRTPLPPYILKARSEHHESFDEADDRAWYQTVYADVMQRRSVAAPTAGLHFTPELLAKIETMGVRRIDVTLHVGPGTFKPVSAATLDQHVMHSEWYEVDAKAMAGLRAMRRFRANSGEHPHPRPLSLAAPQAARERGERVIAVGTTSARTLESLPADALTNAECCGGCRGLTDLLIAPPHVFQHIDGLLTNFHLPRSTLLALVAAMIGLDRVQAVYREAIARGYRFYSYGDAMLILP